MARVPTDASEPTPPFVYRARLSNHRFVKDEAAEQLTSSGKGMTLESAKASALGEAVERYGASNWSADEIVRCPAWGLGLRWLDPRELVLYRDEQYAELPYAPYREDDARGWVLGRSLITDEPVYLPALAVFMGYEVRSPEEYLFPVTSNGLAAGATLSEAILRAALEVIERDAIMIAWMNRLPCRRIDPSDHPDADIRGLCLAYARRGVEIQLYAAPTDVSCHVFLAFGIQRDGDGPAAVAGLGADLSAATAARRAIMEVAQVRPALRRRMRTPEVSERMRQLAADPRLVEKLEDHDLLYASREALPALGFLPAQRLEKAAWESDPTGHPSNGLTALLKDLGNLGHDLIYFDLTSPDLSLLNLHVVRVVIPGFQPIDFGWKERRLGGTRPYDLPCKLGLTGHPTTVATLNPYPHPVS